MKLVLILFGLLGFLSTIIVYSACVASSRISREEEAQELVAKSNGFS